MITIGRSFRFEAAHRLPLLGGRCANLHGHSFAARVAVTGLLDEQTGIIADLHTLETAIGAWINQHLDHTAILADTDPLADILTAAGCRVYRMPRHRQPTVEQLVDLLADTCTDVLHHAGLSAVKVARVQLDETPRNRAVWTP